MVQQAYDKTNATKVAELTHVDKIYSGRKILSDINLVLNENEIHALIGPNGAGKTTLVRIILNLIKHSNGNVKLKYNNIAAMLENDYLFENKTGMDNIKSFGCYFDLDYDKLDEYVKYLGLSDSLNVKVQYYSKGMKRKLSILITVMRGTKFIIFDEPTSGVDPQSRIEIRKLFERLKSNGCTLLITSHDLSEIEKVCDRITILESGHIVKELTNDGSLDLEKEFFNAIGKGDL